MCFFSRPSPPPAPAPEPEASPIEETADAVVVGKQKKKRTDEKELAQGRRLGTKSLQIPFFGGRRRGDLNYPS